MVFGSAFMWFLGMRFCGFWGCKVKIKVLSPYDCSYFAGTQIVSSTQKHTLPPMMVLCKVLKTYLNAAKTHLSHAQPSFKS